MCFYFYFLLFKCNGARVSCSVFASQIVAALKVPFAVELGWAGKGCGWEGVLGQPVLKKRKGFSHSRCGIQSGLLVCCICDVVSVIMRMAYLLDCSGILHCFIHRRMNNFCNVAEK